MTGQTISHYNILEKLGEGGMGVVYRAEDTRLRRPVALKFLSSDLTQDTAAKQRFLQEAQAASALDHPNIAVVHEIDDTADGKSFICMAYYEGRTLKEKIETGRFNIDEAVHIALQIADGLQRAHEAGIIHCDIKPANVMITDHGEAKILDFGVAKLAHRGYDSKTGKIAGTASYMSPEQAQGYKVDRRSDLFSLGILMYEMLTGRRPFAADHELALLYVIVNVDPEPPSAFRPDVPPELGRIVLRLLQKDPAQRYQNASDLRVDLEQFLGVSQPPGGLGSSVRSLLRPIVAIPFAIAFTAFLLLLNPSARDLLWERLGVVRVPAEKHIAVLPFANIGNDSSNQAFCDGLMETLTSKLTQVRPDRGSLWVVAASEVRQRKIVSADEARRTFGATIAVTGSVQRENRLIRLTLNLVDTKTSRQLKSSVVDEPTVTLSALQDGAVMKIAEMLDVKLEPGIIHAVTAGGTSVSQAYDFYLQGRGYLQRYERPDNLNAAVALFELALTEDSAYALAYAGLGEAYWRKFEATKDLRLVDAAVQKCVRALEFNPDLAPVHITLGLVKKGTGEHKEALQEFDEALRLDPANSDAVRELASVYEAIGELDKAEVAHKKAIDMKPSYWAGYNNLGSYYYRRGRYEDAAAQFRKVVELTPDNFRGYNNLGGLYFYLNRWQDARRMFERSIEIEPNYRAYSQLGTLYFFEGRYEDAADIYEKALEVQSTDYRVWGYLASAYHWIPGDSMKAMDALRRAARMAEEQRKLNPRNTEVLCELAGYYVLMGSRERARAFIKQATVLAPKDIVVMARAASVYEQLGERVVALEYLEMALKHGYSLAELEHDPLMRNLRSDPRYEKLLQSIKLKD